ncbi:MAG: histidine kinase [Flavipsychrobacter sp.]|jgi:two-component system phosphate regulon sensor histidine kinase PhoR|nr:histidine kinase [Flavipsychrobacter sp.]
MSLLDTKNMSPRLLSFLTALIIASANALLSIFVAQQWYTPLLVFAVTFIVIYWLYYYTLQRFIYRKIKIIYKFIYQTKATKKEEFFYENILPQKSIEEVSQDVQKWADQRKDEIEVLQKNEQFRREFLMNLAHELRTPIFSIQGYVDTLLGGALEDEEVNRKFLTNASKSIDRLVRLVDDLDEISKLESGKIPLIQETFAIQELIKDVYEELSLNAKAKEIHLLFKKGTEGAIFVTADKQKIKQVLVNLVENAIKYGNDQGAVTAGCYETDDKHVYIEISDDGPGIAEEHLARIFERFYRADRSRSRAIGGTGLGLAIVKHIVEAHGQAVNVRSKLGVGSSFGFTLDKAKP